MFVFREIKSKFFVIFAAATLIVGCGSGGKGNPFSPQKNEVTHTAQEGLTTKQRFIKALEYLENGRHERATAELNAYLKGSPGSARANRLLAQITTPSEEYFPTESFDIKLKSGESLSTLAKKYLGSALKFYALAKYNNISNPSRVNIGQNIKVPSTQLAKSVKAKEEKAQNALNTPIKSDLVDVIEKSEEQAAPELTASANSEEEDDMDSIEKQLLAPKLKPQLRANELINEIKAMVAKQDFNSALIEIAALKKFGDFDKNTRNLELEVLVGHGSQLAESDKVLAAKSFAQARELNLINGDKMAALINLKKAVELDSSNTQTSSDLMVLQKDLADKYHREASSAYRRQELDVAIKLWDKALEIYPEHTNAQVYRAQAIDLKERLNKLNN
jgi:tetratricopeptide (TPR) repeat protein